MKHSLLIAITLGLFSFLGTADPSLINKRTVTSIDRGLAFLAAQQRNGAWYCDVGYKLNNTYQVTKPNVPHVGITAMACMAFLGNGNLPDRGPYGKNVRDGLNFILDCVHPTNGYISRHGTRMYSHAFATLFLAEVYGMTREDHIRPKLQKAVNLIVNCQNSMGGWRYEPIAMDADMSVTVCQVQALRAARNIGIRVPKKTIDRAINYIRLSATKKGAFRYQPTSRSRVSFSTTAAGVTALYGAGVYDDKLLWKGVAYLNNPPIGDPHPSSDHYFYYYGHYYAIQAMYIIGNRKGTWRRWYRKMRDEIISNQNPDGSWEDNVGKIFATSVALINLELPYSYLPIFQK